MEAVKRNPDISVDDLQSEFDYQSEVERQKRKRCDLNEKNFSSLVSLMLRARAWFQDEHGRVHRQMSRMMAMDAYSRHKELINLYYLSHPGATKMLQRDTSKDRTDYDVLKLLRHSILSQDNHKFLWSEEDEAAVATNWEARMAKKYYDKLFKEYCIIDLTYFKKNKIAMRWRTEAEVRSGKGQFICGAKKCQANSDLSSWEVNLKNALVKVRLCRQCSEMLNYGSQKRRIEKKKALGKKKKASGHSGGESDKEHKSDSKQEATGPPPLSLSSTQLSNISVDKNLC
ncbi:unnamed protein product [Haemonchus placei]|uniref:Protein FRA10AC1 homolog n=1 Tax=Haemonchus placei TaxID=6290 RepID=A0A158QQZ5_HAEPC|nr:unnamed protein product [Haemonchus placei]